MKRILLSILFLLVIWCEAQAQILYNFGTTPQPNIAPSPTNSTSWETNNYIPAAVDARVGIASRNTQGTVQLVDAGVPGFTGAYLKFTCGNTGSPNTKFGVNRLTTSSTTKSIQFKAMFPSSSAVNGVFTVFVGNGASLINGLSTAGVQVGGLGTTGDAFAGLSFRFRATGINLEHHEYNAVQTFLSGAVTDDFGDAQNETKVITPDVVHKFTLMMNNSTNSENYTAAGNTYTLAGGTYDIWMDGARILRGATTAGLPVNTQLRDMLVINNGTVGFNDDQNIRPFMYFDDYVYSSTLTSSLLPVTLSKELTAKANGSSVQLNWATGSESNSARFDILHSTDGASFTKIAERATNSPNGADYTFTHFNAPAGANYYKLVQVDKNGDTHAYAPAVANVGVWQSELRAVANDNGVDLLLSSNKAASNVLVSVTDLSGRVVAKLTANVIEGQNSFSVPVRLGAGVYVVSVNGNGVRQVKKIIKN